ncbi:hypothetical protein TEK04_15750 [Klenkia sp. LSe6-5]|uniref:PH domain-containing protein n=1 Tax=Klenkia sesuvii TaxID=3103137 RepID=A0ABU8DXF9_9ACTN
MTDRHGTAPAGPRLTIPANAGLRGVAAVMLLVSVFMTLAFAPIADPDGRLLPIVAFAAVSTGIGVQPILLGTSKLRLRGTHLEVVNTVFTYTATLDDIGYLDHRNGFDVVLRSGRRVGFAGSAPSLVGSISRYVSARRMIVRIEEATGRTWTTLTDWAPGDYPVTRRLRTRAALWCAAYVAGGVTAALSIAAAMH